MPYSQTRFNSMFRWYRRALICYAYCHDVPSGERDYSIENSPFRRSGWFQERAGSSRVARRENTSFFVSKGCKQRNRWQVGPGDKIDFIDNRYWKHAAFILTFGNLSLPSYTIKNVVLCKATCGRLLGMRVRTDEHI